MELMSEHQAYVQRILAITSSCLSIASGISVLVWWYGIPVYDNWKINRRQKFYHQNHSHTDNIAAHRVPTANSVANSRSRRSSLTRPKKRRRVHQFRHDLTLALIIMDLVKAVILITYPTRYLHSDIYLLAPHIIFCDVIGFFTTAIIQASDFAILALAIHTALLIFKPHFKGGLYRYRYIIYSVFFIFLPLGFASIGMVGVSGYTAFTSWCYLVVNPIWYSLVLAWIPRITILVLIVIIYFSVFVYVKIHLYNVSKAIQEVSGNSNSSNSSTDQPSGIRKSSIVVSKVRALRILPIKVKVWLSYMPGLGFLNPYIDGARTSSTNPEWDAEVKPATPRNSFTRNNAIVALPTAMDELALPDVASGSSGNQLNDTARDISKTIQEQLNRERIERFSKRRSIIERQLNSIFIYPLTYILLYIFPMIQQFLYYRRIQVHSSPGGAENYNYEPIYWLALVAAWMKPFNCFVDSLVFVIREGVLPCSSRVRENNRIKKLQQQAASAFNRSSFSLTMPNDLEANGSHTGNVKGTVAGGAGSHSPAQSPHATSGNRTFELKPLSPTSADDAGHPPPQRNAQTQLSIASTLLIPLPNPSSNATGSTFMISEPGEDEEGEAPKPLSNDKASDYESDYNGYNEDENNEDAEDDDGNGYYPGDYDIDYIVSDNHNREPTTAARAPQSRRSIAISFVKQIFAPLWTTSVGNLQEPPQGLDGQIRRQPSRQQQKEFTSIPPQGFKHWDSFSFQDAGRRYNLSADGSGQGEPGPSGHHGKHSGNQLCHMDTIQSEKTAVFSTPNTSSNPNFVFSPQRINRLFCNTNNSAIISSQQLPEVQEGDGNTIASRPKRTSTTSSAISPSAVPATPMSDQPKQRSGSTSTGSISSYERRNDMTSPRRVNSLPQSMRSPSGYRRPSISSASTSSSSGNYNHRIHNPTNTISETDHYKENGQDLAGDSMRTPSPSPTPSRAPSVSHGPANTRPSTQESREQKQLQNSPSSSSSSAGQNPGSFKKKFISRHDRAVTMPTSLESRAQHSRMQRNLTQPEGGISETHSHGHDNFDEIWENHTKSHHHHLHLHLPHLPHLFSKHKNRTQDDDYLHGHHSHHHHDTSGRNQQSRSRSASITGANSDLQTSRSNGAANNTVPGVPAPGGGSVFISSATTAANNPGSNNNESNDTESELDFMDFLRNG